MSRVVASHVLEGKTVSNTEINPGSLRLTIGRDSTVDIILSDPSVEPQHASIYRNTTGIHIIPLGSAEVIVNGTMIKKSRLLESGDRVKLGTVMFHVVGDQLLSPTDESIAVSVRDLVYDEPEKRILNGISFDICNGEFVGLLGPSGCGKSSLLRCILGYVSVTSGSVIAGSFPIPLHATKLWARSGYVPQDDILFAQLTVVENLDYSLRLRCPKWSQEERMRSINRRLQDFHLSSKADDLVAKLSGGERKRVCVIQELLTAPAILFLDEPTSGLDPANEADLMQELRRIADAGTIVVCATHVLDSLAQFTRTIILVRGKMAYDGVPNEMLASLGASNLPELYSESTLLGHATKFRPRPQASPVLHNGGNEIAKSGARFANDFGVFFQRGIRLLMQDRPWMLMLLAQPVVIGLLITLSQGEPARVVESILTFAAVTAVWLGMNNTSRELVKERRHYVRELFFGISPSAYLFGKCAIFSIVGGIQLVLLLIVVRNLNFLAKDQQSELVEVPFVGMFLALFLAYLGAMFAGLAVSAIAKSQESAIAALPLLILPQLLLTGDATGMRSEGRFNSVYYLVDQTVLPARSNWEWTVEVVSLVTWTRPCVAYFKPVKQQTELTPASTIQTAAAANVVHSLLLIAAPAAMLWLSVRWKKRSWVESFGIRA